MPVTKSSNLVTPPAGGASENRPREVVITGVGAVSGYGWGREALWRGLSSGRPAIDEPRYFDPSGHRTRRVSEVPEAPPEVASWVGARPLSRADAFALAAAGEALAHAGLTADDLCAVGPAAGLYFGGSTAAMDGAEAVFVRMGGHRSGPFRARALAAHQLNAPGDAVARRFGISGPVDTVSSACASGGLALAAALDALREGEVELALAGGSDALCQLTYAGFNALRAVDSKPCRPFRGDREGLNLGEGAGVLVLETAEHAALRGARPLARLLGAGASCDAHHMTAPHPQGRGAAEAIIRALADAHWPAEGIEWVNAHGTGTKHNDIAEWRALVEVFGERASVLGVTSTKGAVGHLLGSSGALEAVATVLCLVEGLIHPTPGEGPADPAMAIDLVLGEPRRLPPRTTAISTSFAFGGANAAVVLGAIGAEVPATDWKAGQSG